MQTLDLPTRDRTPLATHSTARFFESNLQMLPGVHIPLRSMLVTAGADTLLISPVGSADERDAATGRNITLVAPSLFHHKHLARARENLDVTGLWAPQGFKEHKPELAPIKQFDRDPWPYRDTLPYVVIGGAPRRNEVVFFHPPTRTIYTADLVFNVQEPAGILTPLAFRAMGIYKRFAVARMWKSWVKDRAAFDRSIAEILAWDFDRIAMAHGDIVESGGRELLIEALRERELHR